jgi:hypothetical protein
VAAVLGDEQVVVETTFALTPSSVSAAAKAAVSPTASRAECTLRVIHEATNAYVRPSSSARSRGSTSVVPSASVTSTTASSRPPRPSSTTKT